MHSGHTSIAEDTLLLGTQESHLLNLAPHDEEGANLVSLYRTWNVDSSDVETNYSVLSGTHEAIYKTKGQRDLHKT